MSQRTLFLRSTEKGPGLDATRRVLEAVSESGRGAVRLIYCADSLAEQLAAMERASALADLKNVEHWLRLGPEAVTKRQLPLLRGAGRARVLLRLEASWHGMGAVLARDRALFDRWVGAGAELAGADIPCRMDVMLGAAAVDRLPEALRELERKVPGPWRLSANLTDPWDNDGKKKLIKTLEAWLQALVKAGGRGAALRRLDQMEVSAGLLEDSLLLDERGRLQWANAYFLGEAFPKLRGLFEGGDSSIEQLLGKIGTRRRLYREIQGRHSASRNESRLLERSVLSSLQLEQFFRGWQSSLRKNTEVLADSSEHQDVIWLMRQDVATQQRLRAPSHDKSLGASLFLKTGCVNDCLFCKGKPEEQYEPLEDIARRLARAPGSNTYITIVADEPLLYPRIVDVVRLCRDRGFKPIEIMTSGTLLSDRALTDALVEAGASIFAIPIYSMDAARHDAITGRAGSFDRTMQGLAHLKSHQGLSVHIHTHLLRQNMEVLPDLESFVRDELKLPFCILPIRPKDPGGMHRPYAELAPSYEEMSSGLKVRSLAGFPVCVMRRIQSPAVLEAGQISETVMGYMRHQNYFKPESCGRCSVKDSCLGTFEKHLEAYPDDALDPI